MVGFGKLSILTSKYRNIYCSSSTPLFREHENYLKLELKYDGPHKFSGIGTHLGSGETFEIIEGEVNKRTKYWKFIALYENSLKKVKGKMNEKRLVQVSYRNTKTI